jgi:hypothetical protein
MVTFRISELEKGIFMKAEIKEITPRFAQYVLDEKNTFNRPPSKNEAELIAADMRAGMFPLTHQGIAFDADGVLVDGQTRLSAIVLYGKPVKMWVFTYHTRTFVTEDGRELDIIYVLDGGRKRSIGQNLQLSGVNNGNVVAAMCNAIQMHLVKPPAKKLTTSQTDAILDIYREPIQTILETPSLGVKHAAFLSVLAMFNAGFADQERRLTSSFISMEGLAPGSPVIALRKFVVDKLPNMAGGTNRTEAMKYIISGCMKFIDGGPVSKLCVSDDAIRRFDNAQNGHREKVRTALGRLCLN